jgi:hypothetical protein
VNLDDAMKEDSDQQADLVRISGKSWSEFPEPTRGSSSTPKEDRTVASTPWRTRLLNAVRRDLRHERLRARRVTNVFTRLGIWGRFLG